MEAQAQMAAMLSKMLGGSGAAELLKKSQSDYRQERSGSGGPADADGSASASSATPQTDEMFMNPETMSFSDAQRSLLEQAKKSRENRDEVRD
jgi:hypothetical protein